MTIFSATALTFIMMKMTLQKCFLFPEGMLSECFLLPAIYFLRDET